MSKRKAGDSLTGGTGDVSPQILNLGNLTLTAANTFTQRTVPVPVQRYSASRDRALVMECLKVYMMMADTDTNNSAGGSAISSYAQLSTASQTAIQDGSPQVFVSTQKTARGAFTAAGTYQAVDIDPIVLDLTDGAGHGILIATDNIYYGCVTANFAGAPTFNCKILYRFKEVSLAEYIGIVQSQQ